MIECNLRCFCLEDLIKAEQQIRTPPPKGCGRYQEWEGAFCAFVCWEDIACFFIFQDVAIKSILRGDGEMG